MNEVDPFTQERLDELQESMGYAPFVIEQEDGKKFGFDPVALTHYILREGKAVNVFNRLPFTVPQLQQLQQVIDELHRTDKIREHVNIIQFLQDHGKNIQKELHSVQKDVSTLEMFLLEFQRQILICCKFYDEDVAATVLHKRVLPQFKQYFLQLLEADVDSARMVVKSGLEALRGLQLTYPLSIAVASLKKMEKMMRPIFVIQRV